MAINFPASPALNQEYTYEDRSWRWNGTYWQSISVSTGYTGSQGDIGYSGSQGDTGYVGSQGESTFTWGNTAPVNPAVGDRWYDTVTSCLTVYVDDGDSQQWVEVAASGFLGQTGYTGSQGESGTGQMYGNSAVKAIMYNSKVVDEDITISSDHNAGSFGPIEIASGYTVELQANAVWTIV